MVDMYRYINMYGSTSRMPVYRFRARYRICPWVVVWVWGGWERGLGGVSETKVNKRLKGIGRSAFAPGSWFGFGGLGCGVREVSGKRE